MVGTPNTRLVILRGNSGSGKTLVARALQKRREVGRVAVVSQDLVRRDVLRASDTVGWDLPFEKTLRRYATKVTALESGESEMREWWYGTALIPELDEARIGPGATLDATVRRIEDDCRWV